MLRIRDMDSKDLPIVLEWRNRPEIRAAMYTQHTISLEEHTRWWDKVSQEPTKKYLMCDDDCGKPVGTVNFTEISPQHKTASWGFYSGDTSVRGIGSQMERLALDFAFKSLGVEKLCCEVLSTNIKVVQFHRKHGFRIEGIFRKQFYNGKEYSDIYRLAIFKKDWERFLESQTKVPKVGDSHIEPVRFTKEDIRRFAEVSGDKNPVHLDPAAAQKEGFSGVLCHGIFAASVFSKILGTRFPGAGTIYVVQNLDFKKPVYADIECSAEVRVVSRIGRRLILETQILANGEVLVSGEAEVVVPDKS